VTLVAVRDFVDPSDGLPVRKGVTYIDETSDLAHSHPQCFKPASRKLEAVTRVGGRVQVAESGKVASTGASDGVRFYPTLPPVYEATITVEARKQIDREFEEMLRPCSAGLLPGSHVETGGLLLVDPERPLEIVAATGPGDEARYTEGSVRLDFAAAQRAKRDNPRLRVAGDWHVHFDAHGRPSSTDRNAWSKMRGLDGADVHIGIILAAESAWQRDLAGWITFREAGHIVCEPLALREK
jgi:proteasome lid subunit RPN8/RPN11